MDLLNPARIRPGTSRAGGARSVKEIYTFGPD